MTRIEGATNSEAGPLGRVLLALARRKLRKLTGRSPAGGIGPLAAYARLPRLLLGYGAFEDATARLHGVPERLKALAELKAATISNCEYCIDIGSQIARRSGIADEQLLALPAYRDSNRFDPLEKLVLDYAVGISSTPVNVPDELFASLRERFDERQLIELTNVIALENMRGRFNLALGYGAAGFSEGMVCAVPEPGDRPRQASAGRADGAPVHAQAAAP